MSSPNRRLDQAALLWPALLAGLVLLFVLVNARWIWLYRHAQPLDIDEAGYRGIALADYHALRAFGLIGWLRSVEAPSIQAPLTTGLASLVDWAAGPHVVAGFAVPVLAAATAIVATYLLARSLASPAAALAAAALVASCPIVLNYARSFHFAMPATAVMTVGLLGLVRSARLARIGWASLFGICLGLLPLARTMTIAFLPGLILAAAVQAVATPDGRTRRLLVLCWALALAGATMATWLLPNGIYVFHYLFSFGYGSRAAEFGAKQPFLSLDAWAYTLRSVVGAIYLPHTLVLLAGAAGLPVLLTVRAKQLGGAAWMRAILTSPALPLAVCIAEALAALTSSQNKGSVFVAPIVPAMLVLAVWVLVRLGSRPGYRRWLGVGCAWVCILAAAPLADLSWAAARPVAVTLPGLGGFIVTDGRGTIQLYEHTYGGFGEATAAQPLSPAEGRAWVVSSVATAAVLQGATDAKAVVAFGFRHALYNVNTVRLQMLLEGADVPALVQVEPVLTGDTVAGFRAWLTAGEAAHACLLLTLSGEGGEFQPPVAKPQLEEAARQAGFVPLQGWRMPDGRETTLWRRHTAAPPCPG